MKRIFVCSFSFIMLFPNIVFAHRGLLNYPYFTNILNIFFFLIINCFLLFVERTFFKTHISESEEDWRLMKEVLSYGFIITTIIIIFSVFSFSDFINLRGRINFKIFIYSMTQSIILLLVKILIHFLYSNKFKKISKDFYLKSFFRMNLEAYSIPPMFIFGYIVAMKYDGFYVNFFKAFWMIFIGLFFLKFLIRE